MTKKTFGRAQPAPVSAPVLAPAPEPITKEPFSDLRRAKRSRTLLAGKLCFGSGLSADCTISDLSDSGARVRSNTAAIIPPEVFLVHLRDQRAFEATVVWRRANGNLGLKFKAVHDLRDPSTDELKLLRAHCVEHGLRTSMPGA
jgi:PilZ domain-containing protein